VLFFGTIFARIGAVTGWSCVRRFLVELRNELCSVARALSWGHLFPDRVLTLCAFVGLRRSLPERLILEPCKCVDSLAVACLRVLLEPVNDTFPILHCHLAREGYAQPLPGRQRTVLDCLSAFVATCASRCATVAAV